MTSVTPGTHVRVQESCMNEDGRELIDPRFAGVTGVVMDIRKWTRYGRREDCATIVFDAPVKGSTWTGDDTSWMFPLRSISPCEGLGSEHARFTAAIYDLARRGEAQKVLYNIAERLSGQECTASTCDYIARLLHEAGIPIADIE